MLAGRVGGDFRKLAVETYSVIIAAGWDGIRRN
jgi:hypothetical protein